MRILLTNDDGIHAPGLAVLERVARSLSDDVWIVAPSSEQSGAGHSLTLTTPVRVRQHGPRRFAVQGTPTDSVLMALGKLMGGERPDLLLSGINRGANLAEDVTYSGTVSAAMEGCLGGIPSIALSQQTVERPVGEDAFSVAEAHAAPLIRALFDLGWPRDVLINVNFPAGDHGPVRGVRVTEQGFRNIGETIIDERTDVRGFPYYWFGLGRETDEPGHESDLKAIRESHISVTPLHLDLTHRETMERMRSALAEKL
jgi:5'-nucleotidase